MTMTSWLVGGWFMPPDSERKLDAERSAATIGRFDAHRAVVGPHDRVRQIQADAKPPAPGPGLIEALKHAFAVLGSNSWAVVAHLYHRRVALATQRNLCARVACAMLGGV